MMDLMKEMNGNLEDKLNNGQSRVFSLQAKILQVYPSLGNYSEYFFTNLSVLENSYGISLRKLTNYAKLLYDGSDNFIDPLVKTTLVLLLKLEGQLISRNPKLYNALTLVLNNIDYQKGLYCLDGKNYKLTDKNIKGLDYNNPYQINSIEEDIINSLIKDFKNSPRLKVHLRFLLEKGSVYKVYNDNLIYHGCVPLDENGNYKSVYTPAGLKSGRELFDYLDTLIRKVVLGSGGKDELDYLYYLWNGYDSPFTGRWYKTFELAFLTDKSLQNEARNPYYDYRNQKEVCLRILDSFGVSQQGHIINGHLPVKVSSGESPIKAEGKLIIIDGGFCQAYHKKTGIAGYTLISNSHGLRIKAHKEFPGLDEVLAKNKDIISSSTIIETYLCRLENKDTTDGKELELLLNGLRKQLK